MIFGMTTSPFTFVHVVLSLVGIGSGFIVLFGLLTRKSSALIYLAAGEALLAEDCWERRYALTFGLAFHGDECEYLTGNLAAAEERLSMLSRRAAGLVDRVSVTCLRVVLYTTMDRPDRSVEICLEYLRDAGIEWSPHPTDEEVQQEYERMWQQIGGRPFEAHGGRLWATANAPHGAVLQFTVPVGSEGVV